MTLSPSGRFSLIWSLSGESHTPQDFGIHFTTLYDWMKKADIEDGDRPGTTQVASAELREARRRIRLLEQENEVLRRAAAYLSQANLPGK